MDYFCMKKYASLCHCLIILLSLILEKFSGDIDRDTRPHNRNIPRRRGGGWENHFPSKRITCLILKGAHVKTNRIWSHIYSLIFFSNKSINKLYIVIIDVDAVCFTVEMKWAIIYLQAGSYKEIAVAYPIPYSLCQFDPPPIMYNLRRSAMAV